MNLWLIDNWKNFYEQNDISCRSGLRLRCDKEVNPEVKRACKEFCKWLRTQYYFPIRIPVYIKSSNKIRARDGDMVSAVFFGPYNKCVEPYISIAAGDYFDLLKKMNKDRALSAILHSVSHELTHYFQWINDVHLTPSGVEKQASYYANYILNCYRNTREHP